jgi:preprotein translocase subunit YajC
MTHFPLLLARILQEAPPTGAEDSAPGASPLAGLLPFLLIGLIFYFLVLRPESKRRKDQQKMLSALEKGDRVITTSGLFATVAQVQGQVLTLELADKVRVQAALWAVQQKVEENQTTPPPAPARS